MPSDPNFLPRLLRDKFGDDSSITLEQHQEYFMEDKYDEFFYKYCIKINFAPT